MRTMCDACNPANYEAGHDLYASYVDGSCATNRSDPVRISSIATNAGNVGDCEPGNPAPTAWVDWVIMRRNAGVDPSIYVAADQLGSYFNGYKWQNVRSAFTARGIAEPHYWICYPGFSSIPAGAMAVQTGFMNGFDISLVVDFWPGVDTADPPPDPVSAPPHYVQGGYKRMIRWDRGDGKPQLILLAPSGYLEYWIAANDNALVAQGPSAVMTYNGDPLAGKITDVTGIIYPSNNTVILYARAAGVPNFTDGQVFMSIWTDAGVLEGWQAVNGGVAAAGPQGPAGAAGPDEDLRSYLKAGPA